MGVVITIPVLIVKGGWTIPKLLTGVAEIVNGPAPMAKAGVVVVPLVSVKRADWFRLT